MHKIVLPKINNNDESYVLLEWRFEDGQRINKEDEIAVFETSKAAFDLSSETDGILHRLPTVGSDCKPGDILGYVFETETERQSFLSKRSALTAAEQAAFTLTKGAQALVEANNLSITQLATLGKSVIKKSHVELLLQQLRQQLEATAEAGTGSEAAQAIPIPRQQIAVARTVEMSHREVPKAFLLMKVYCDTANQALQAHNQKHGVMLGLPELLIKVTASLQAKFPFFFGTVVDGDRFIPAPGANVGVTLDLGKGLFIPVVEGADAKSLSEIADTLMAFRLKAMRGQFQEAELMGGTISISLNTDQDSLVTLPIILPGQTCMLTLSSLQEELFFTTDQAVASRTYTHLGLAYDHRVINGYDAAQFLATIKTQIEGHPDTLLNCQGE